MKLISEAPRAHCESPGLILVTQISFLLQLLTPASTAVSYSSREQELVCVPYYAMGRTTVPWKHLIRPGSQFPASPPLAQREVKFFTSFWMVLIFINVIKMLKLNNAVLRKEG